MSGRQRLPRVPSPPFRTSERLARLDSHLRANLTKPFPASAAARMVKLHRVYFSVFFRRRVGMPFHRWVQLVRLRKALEILRKSRLPIARVAAKCGFGTTRSLERATQRFMGCSPREYRKGSRRKRGGPA